MRVLHAVPLKDEASGPTVVVAHLVQHLVSRGHMIGILPTYPSEGRVLHQLRGIGAHVYEYGGSRRSFGSESWARALDPLLQTYDLVHIHGIFNPLHAALAGRLTTLGIPYVLSPHGNLMPRALEHRRLVKSVALHTVLRGMLGNARAFHALADEEANAIRLRRPAARIQTIPNGVSIPECLKRPRPMKIGDEGLRMLFIGRLDVHHKGLDTLLNAVEYAATDLLRLRVRIDLVGPYQTARDRRFFAKRLTGDVSSIVRVLGPKYGHDKQRLLEECDVFVHTSRYEGLPMAVLEAMAAGRACLVTPGTNMAAVITKASAGIVSEESPAKLAAAVKRTALLAREVLDGFGQNGREWCKRNHTWGTIMEQYEMFYQDALAREAYGDSV